MDLLAQAMERHQRGDLSQAEIAYRELLLLQPQHPDALHLLGVARAQQGDLARGAELIRQALVAQPGTPVFQQNLAGVLVNLATGQRQAGDFTAAAHSLREAIAYSPDHWQAHTNLGNLLTECGRLEEAERCLRQAWQLMPERAEIAYSLGALLLKCGRVTESEILLRRAVRAPELHLATLCNLGQCLKDQGRIREALDCYEEALRLQPDWPEVVGNRLHTLTYSTAHSAEDVVEAHREWGQRLSARTASKRQSFIPGKWDGVRKLRVGYLSADFRNHAMMFFVETLLEHHDRSRVEIFCYACTRQTDAVTERLRSYGDTWRCLDGLTDEVAAELIRRDGLDVLVDLAGHTAGNRLPMLALRVAPVQATCMGYTHTTGLPEMDCRLTDVMADPPGMERFNTETLVRLPRSIWCYRPLENSPPVAPLPARQCGYITFGSFNRWEKWNEQTLERWAEILRRCPGSHLRLKAAPFADTVFARALLQQWKRRGIDPQRIELVSARQPTALHLQEFNRVDISLDTHPFSGCTTTMESLWMGVPVVTLAGDNAMSRMSVSFLYALGLETECVAATEDAYIEKACALANRLAWLEMLRDSLRARIEQSPLRDSAGYVRTMEAVLCRLAKSGVSDFSGGSGG